MKDKTVQFIKYLLAAALIVGILAGGAFCFLMFYCVVREPETDIKVKGATVYSPVSVRRISGVIDGDSVFSVYFHRNEIAADIAKKMPYVKSVDISVETIHSIVFTVTETMPSYCIYSGDVGFVLLDADGKVLEKNVDPEKASAYAELRGFKRPAFECGEVFTVLEKEDLTMKSGEKYSATYPTREQLWAFVSDVRHCIQENGIDGIVAYDVRNYPDLELLYRNEDVNFRIGFGDDTNITSKAEGLKDVLASESNIRSAGKVIISTADDGTIRITSGNVVHETFPAETETDAQ